MALIYIVRHGHAAASFTDDLDPGLSESGKAEALRACEALATASPLEIRSSPLKRAQETASPLIEALGQSSTIEERFAEIPSPGMSLSERGPWLGKVMQGNWSDQSKELKAWRAALIECMKTVDRDTVIFSHFVAINAAVGAAEGDDRVLLFRPDNGSITKIENDGGSLSLVARGHEANTEVN